MTMARSVEMKLRVWYDPKSRHIKLAGPGLTASTISPDPSSVRHHPNLYRKLAAYLRTVGADAPDEIVE